MISLPLYLLQGKDPQFITALVAKLRMEYYAEGDIVVHEADYGNVMYFVVKGNLEARQYIWEPDAEPQVCSQQCGAPPPPPPPPSNVATGSWKLLRV